MSVSVVVCWRHEELLANDSSEFEAREASLTLFEWLYVLGQPFVSQHMARVRRDIKALTARYASPTKLLDVGARKSHYTIGVAAKVVLLDLPRETSLQNELHLGVTDHVLGQLQERRSNVRDYLVGDFFDLTLPVGAFEIVTAIEVIEHIVEDRRFVEKASRLLGPGGSFYLTTPNGATMPNSNPDHVRHYTAEELRALLLSCFPRVSVEHGEVMTPCWSRGLGWWRPTQPLMMSRSLLANFINRLENRWMSSTTSNCARLFAVAWKE